MPALEDKQRGYQSVRNATIKTLTPTPEELAQHEPGVEIHKTPHGVEFGPTPGGRFVNLPGYDFAPSYLEIDGLRMHYADVGPRAFPSMVNQCGARNAVAWGGLAPFTRSFLHIRGTRDLQFGTQEMQDEMVDAIPGARGQPHTALDGGHYIQDNQGEAVASLLVDFIERNPSQQGPVPRIPRS
jgi:pimeloyl-ACP methyl ester carboxylesterase